MAIIKKNELKQMDKKTLSEKLLGLKKELVKVNAHIAMGSLPENPGRTREIKRTIARLITILKQKDKEVSQKDE